MIPENDLWELERRYQGNVGSDLAQIQTYTLRQLICEIRELQSRLREAASMLDRVPVDWEMGATPNSTKYTDPSGRVWWKKKKPNDSGVGGQSIEEKRPIHPPMFSPPLVKMRLARSNDAGNHDVLINLNAINSAEPTRAGLKEEPKMRIDLLGDSVFEVYGTIDELLGRVR